MTDEHRPSDTEKQTGGVTIGDVAGGIRGAIIAGRDVIIGSSTNEKRKSRKSSIPVPPNPYFPHHYALGANFTGRVSERQMLSHWLLHETKPVFTLVAMGGMGKTSLTWYWLQNGLDLSILDGLLWWSFDGGEAAFPHFLTEAISYTSNQAIDPADLSFHDQVQTLVNLLRKRRFLIILDSFEQQLRSYASIDPAHHPDLAKHESRDARACVDPFATQFLRRMASDPTEAKLLITTRLMIQDLEDSTGDPLHGCRKERLNPLSPDDAVTFMHSQGVTKGTNAEIKATCGSYGYHPLSLRILSGLIRRDKKHPGDIAATKRYQEHADLVRSHDRILATAYDALPVPLRSLLSRIAAFRGLMSYDVLQVLNKFEDTATFDQALDELIERGLLSFDASQARFDLHPLVRAYAYDRLADPIEVHAQLRDYFATITAPDSKDVYMVGDLSPMIELYHHMVKSRHFDDAWQLYESRLRRPLYYGFCAYEIEIQLLNSLLGTDDDMPQVQGTIAQTWVLLYLSMCYERIGQLDSALTCARRAVDLNRRESQQADLGSSLVALASVYKKLGQLGSARDASAQAVTIFDELRDMNWYGISHRNYGGFLIVCGDLTEAEENLNLAEEVYTYRPDQFTHGLVRLMLYRTYLLEFRGDHSSALKIAKHAYAAACMGSVKPQRQGEWSGTESRRRFWTVIQQVLGQLVKEEVPGLEPNASCLDSAYYKREATSALYRIGYLQCIEGESEKAQVNLEKALQSCRSVRLTDLEPDVLLALAKFHSTRASPKERASQEVEHYAQEALTIVERCGYRLKQADIHSFLARWKLDADHLTEAHHHACLARDLAWCDGPPNAYQSALDEANEILREIEGLEQR
jgi:tetratricopeptide (TPR) repeat protein